MVSLEELIDGHPVIQDDKNEIGACGYFVDPLNFDVLGHLPLDNITIKSGSRTLGENTGEREADAGLSFSVARLFRLQGSASRIKKFSVKSGNLPYKCTFDVDRLRALLEQEYLKQERLQKHQKLWVITKVTDKNQLYLDLYENANGELQAGSQVPADVNLDADVRMRKEERASLRNQAIQAIKVEEFKYSWSFWEGRKMLRLKGGRRVENSEQEEPEEPFYSRQISLGKSKGKEKFKDVDDILKDIQQKIRNPASRCTQLLNLLSSIRDPCHKDFGKVEEVMNDLGWDRESLHVFEKIPSGRPFLLKSASEDEYVSCDGCELQLLDFPGDLFVALAENVIYIEGKIFYAFEHLRSGLSIGINDKELVLKEQKEDFFTFETNDGIGSLYHANGQRVCMKSSGAMVLSEEEEIARKKVAPVTFSLVGSNFKDVKCAE